MLDDLHFSLIAWLSCFTVRGTFICKRLEIFQIKAKYENMPPIEHFRPEHFAKFFPEMHRDVRLPIERFTMGDKTTSTPEHFKELQELFKDYRSRELPGQS